MQYYETKVFPVPSYVLTLTLFYFQQTNVQVHGAEEKVAAAKVLILDLLSSAEAKVAGSKVLIVPAASVAVIIGAKGATVRDIQDKTGVRFDFDRVTHKCSIKGTVEGVESAIKLVDDILSREGFPAAFVEGQSPPRSATPVVTATAAVVDGAAEDQVSMDKRPKVCLLIYATLVCLHIFTVSILHNLFAVLI